MRGLKSAGLAVFATRNVADTVAALKNGHRHAPMLVGEVQAGGIALLHMLHEQGAQPPATVLFDRTGDDIHAPIDALQMGVRDYLLATDPETQREMRVRMLAEQVMECRVVEDDGSGLNNSAHKDCGFCWNAVSHIVDTGSGSIRLSPIEGRMFDLLLTNRSKTVTVRQLLELALVKKGIQPEDGVKLVRPHMVRLRNRFDHFPGLAHRIVNMRGTGYMLV